MAYSRWRCILHPRKTAAEIDRLAELCDTLSRDAEGRENELAAMRAAVMTSRESDTITRRRCEELERQLGAANQRIAEMGEEIDEQRIDEEQYDKIVKAIDDFGTLKAQYRDRIKSLQRDLDTARRALRESHTRTFEYGDDDDASELLDGRAYSRRKFGNDQPSKVKRDDQKSDKINDSDWLQQLPENL